MSDAVKSRNGVVQAALMWGRKCRRSQPAFEVVDEGAEFIAVMARTNLFGPLTAIRF